MTYISILIDIYHFIFRKKVVFYIINQVAIHFLIFILMNAQYYSGKNTFDLEEFASQLARCMNCPNQPEKAVQAIKDIFGMIRSRLPFEESLEFINLLPLSLKAVYLDGWHIGDHPSVPFNSMEELIDEIIANRTEVNNWYNSNRDELRNTLRALFQLIGAYVVETDMEININFLPQDIHYFIVHNHFEIENPADTDSSIWLS